AVSAAGDAAARRAMPTSVASASRVRPSAKSEPPPVAGKGGGQSTAELPELLPPEPASIVEDASFLSRRRSSGESPPDHGCFWFGPCASYMGKRADCRTGRLRTSTIGAVGERTDDMAHLAVPAQYFAFSSPCQYLFSLLLRLHHPPLKFDHRLSFMSDKPADFLSLAMLAAVVCTRLA